jgi:hypothetical protein
MRLPLPLQWVLRSSLSDTNGAQRSVCHYTSLQPVSSVSAGRRRCIEIMQRPVIVFVGDYKDGTVLIESIGTSLWIQNDHQRLGFCM